MRKKLIVGLILCFILFTIGCSSKSNQSQDKSIAYAEKLYQYQDTYTGDNSKVGAIVHALNFTKTVRRAARPCAD